MPSLAQLIDRLTERVGNNSTYWVAEEKADAINEGICVWHALTGEWNDKVLIPVVPGQVFYQTPSQLTGVQRIKVYLSQIGDRLVNPTLLVGSSLPEFDLAYGDWQSTPGDPQLWASNGINEFALFPQPLVGTIQIEGMTDAPRLTSDADQITLGDEHITPLLAYGHYYLTLKEGGAEMQSALDGLKEFIEAASHENATLLKASFYMKYMGLPREEGLRPPHGAARTVGAR